MVVVVSNLCSNDKLMFNSNFRLTSLTLESRIIVIFITIALQILLFREIKYFDFTKDI